MLVYNVHHIKASKKQYNWSHFSNKKEFFRHKNERENISRECHHTIAEEDEEEEEAKRDDDSKL